MIVGSSCVKHACIVTSTGCEISTGIEFDLSTYASIESTRTAAGKSSASNHIDAGAIVQTGLASTVVDNICTVDPSPTCSTCARVVVQAVAA